MIPKTPNNERLVSAIAYQAAFRAEMGSQVLVELNELLHTGGKLSHQALAILVRIHAYWLPLPFPYQGDKIAWLAIHQLQGKGSFNGARAVAKIIYNITVRIEPNVEFQKEIMPEVLIRSQELKNPCKPANEPLLVLLNKKYQQ